MQFYPTKKQFDLPSFLIKQGNVFGLEFAVVGQERERSLKVRSIVHYSPQFSRILLFSMIALESYHLIQKHIICAVQNILAINHLVIKAGLLSYDKIEPIVAIVYNLARS